MKLISYNFLTIIMYVLLKALVRATCPKFLIEAQETPKRYWICSAHSGGYGEFYLL
jgi:hypothetical protein